MTVKKRVSRVCSLALALVMTVSILPMSALAEGTKESAEKPQSKISLNESSESLSIKVVKDEGITVLMDGEQVNDSTTVNKGDKHSFELVPDEKHSVLKVMIDGRDITKEVDFKEYKGTLKKSFDKSATLEVKTVAVSEQLVLKDREKRIASFALKEDGNPDWEQIRKNFIEGFIDEEKSVIKFTPENTKFQEWKQVFLLGGAGGAWFFSELEGENKTTSYFKPSVPAMNLKFQVRFLGDNQFRPTEFNEFYGDVVDSQKSDIAVKDNYNKNFKLQYNASGEYDYNKLRREIFDAVVDTSKSTKLVTFENVKITYQIVDAMNSHTGIGAGGYYDFEQRWLGADQGGTYKYLYKGGDFNFKIAMPKMGSHNADEVVVNLHVDPADRQKSQVVLKDGTVNYNSPAELKKEVLKLIDYSASKLPENVTADNFKFEYYTKNYTAGGLLGVESWWVPFEGMDHPTLAGSYFKAISVGSHKIKITYRGNEQFTDSTSNEVTLVVDGAHLKTSLTRDFKYVDEKISKDLVKTESAASADFDHYYIMVDASNPTATIYIDSSLGLKMTDFTANVPFNDILLQIFGIGSILSADEIYQRRGLSRDEMNTLLNDGRFKWYMQAYQGIDANAVQAIIDTFNRLPESVTHFKFKIDQPTRAGEYYFMAITAKQNFNTAVATNDKFYVKYHSRGVKLHFREDASKINIVNAGSFDYSAVLTKNGIPIKSDHVKYLYVGLSLTGGVVLSTTNPPRSAGFYFQIAYTGFGGRLALPISRSIKIAL